MKFKFISILFALFFSSHLLATDAYFKNLKEDHKVPNHCQDTKIDFFSNTTIDVFTFGLEGSTSRGFTFAYELNREQAGFLWDVFRYNNHNSRRLHERLKREPNLRASYEVLRANEDLRNFDFHNEGDILELLALEWLQVKLNQRYGHGKYFVHGSIEYHYPGRRTMGELDLLIARTDNCKVVGFGESKLGYRGIGKAREQLRRFQGFIDDLRGNTEFEPIDMLEPHIRFH